MRCKDILRLDMPDSYCFLFKAKDSYIMNFEITKEKKDILFSYEFDIIYKKQKSLIVESVTKRGYIFVAERIFNFEYYTIYSYYFIRDFKQRLKKNVTIEDYDEIFDIDRYIGVII